MPQMRPTPPMPTSSSGRYRAVVASRLIAGAGGGYAVAWLWAAALALLLHDGLGLARADAALLATLASILVYCAAVLSAFATRSAVRAWVILAIAATPAAFVVIWLR
jgi:hypothetical protein